MTQDDSAVVNGGASVAASHGRNQGSNTKAKGGSNNNNRLAQMRQFKSGTPYNNGQGPASGANSNENNH